MHGPLRLTYAFLANYMAKCQMSSGPYGPIFAYTFAIKCLCQMLAPPPTGNPGPAPAMFLNRNGTVTVPGIWD